MNLAELPFESIQQAVKKLNNPEVIWLRGHAQDQPLMPALFRLKTGHTNEKQLLERYQKRNKYSFDENNAFCNLSIHMAMHNNCEPTRLVEWTESLHVALFFALTKGPDNPTLFVLDPVKLNSVSEINCVVRVSGSRNANLQIEPGISFAPQLPFAIESRITHNTLIQTNALFTFHSSAQFFLEDQLLHCVEKITLSDEEKYLAEEGILSGKWISQSEKIK